MSYVLRLTESSALNVALSGSKGANVAFLSQQHFPVPTGFIVTSKGYESFIHSGRALIEQVKQWDFTHPEQISQLSEQLRAALTELPLPSSLITQVYEMLAEYPESQVFAIRSSLLVAQSPESGGQGETYLNFVGEDAVFAGIRNCFLSLWKENAIIERHQRGLADHLVSTAIVIQQLVKNDVMGLTFTCHPQTSDLNTWLIQASTTSKHLNQAIHCDCWTVNAQSGDIIEYHPANANQTGNELLSAAQLVSIIQLSQNVAKLYDTPQIIDWGISRNFLYLLQTRPLV